MEKHTCPGCENGKINVTVHNCGSITQIKWDCTWCHGTGQLDNERMQAYNDFKNVWCKCEGDDLDIQYYEDGEHPQLSKHHYRHRACGKVVQIG